MPFLMPQIPFPQGTKIQELYVSISTQGYLTATFQWFHIVNKQLHDPK